MPALAYVNIRVNNDKYRTFKIAMCHCWLLSGFLVAAILETELIKNETIQSELHINVTVNYGYAMIAIAVPILIGYIVNDSLQYFSDEYDYKVPLDTTLYRENNYGILMSRRWFDTGATTEVSRYTEMVKPIGKNTTKCILRTIFLIASKATSLVYFYVPFMYINMWLSIGTVTDIQQFLPFVAYLLGVVGIFVSTILLIFTSVQDSFIVSCTLKIIAVFVVTIMMGVVGIEGTSAEPTKVIFWCAYALFGYGYSHPDINILELTVFKWSELLLSIGFIVEMIIIMVFQYYIHFDLSVVFQQTITDGHEIILTHSIVFVVIFVILGLVSFTVVIPNTFGLSLLEIKNLLVGIQLENNKQQQQKEVYPQWLQPSIVQHYPVQQPFNPTYVPDNDYHPHRFRPNPNQKTGDISPIIPPPDYPMGGTLVRPPIRVESQRDRLPKNSEQTNPRSQDMSGIPTLPRQHLEYDWRKNQPVPAFSQQRN